MDIEEGNIGGDFAFTEKSVRRAFVRKTYAILSLQLVITLGIMSIFTFSENVQDYFAENPNILWVPFALSIVLIIVLLCAGDLRRKIPYNFIFLFLFTICEGVMIGTVSAYYETKDVAIAVVATIAVVAGLTLFAFQTKIDFTMMSGMIFSLGMVLIMFGIFALIFQDEVLNMVYACLGTLVFSLYLVFDTQLILGGKHKISISPEEYIYAALNLYLDIINLFLLLLSIIGGSK